jgi:AcrR family transcriptional regulator
MPDAMAGGVKAAERRALILRAAVKEFGRQGYEGTSTASIARLVGVSQPYLFRLYGSKKRLFTETAEWALAELGRILDEAAKGADHAERLASCAAAVTRPTAARNDLLRFELALYGAADDPELASLARWHLDSLWRRVAKATGAPRDELSVFFGQLSMTIVRALLDDRVH